MTTPVAQLDARPHTQSIRNLLLALAVLFAGLATYLHPWISAFSFFILAWRLWAASRNAPMPRRWMKILLAIVGFIMVLASYRTLNGVEAGSALLMVMIALKLTEVQRLRDAVFVVVLGYFLLFAGFLYSQEIPFVAWMLLAGWTLTAALLVITRNTANASFLDGMRRSGRYLAQALPFAVIIFVLFPRIPGPLWGVPLQSGDSVSGLDDEMTPGSISSLVMSEEIAFRVKFDGPLPPRNERYWRGPTLLFFDGRTWIPGFEIRTDELDATGLADPVRYTVMLEAHQRRWLYALTVPVDYPDDARLMHDYTLTKRRRVGQRISYDVVSYMEHLLSPRLTELERRWALQMPEGFNQRSRDLAARWRASGATDAEIVTRALTMFREQPFRYTLQPPPLRGDTVDDFLFNTQAGFCEHYASAFTFLMRAAGVPARVVTGYLGGELNEYSGYLEVRQSDAHAWSEVWLAGRGWTRIDPTGAVAPQRVERGIAEALDSNELPTHLLQLDDFLWELESRWRALNTAWYEFFLGYGPEMQKTFLESLGLENPDWRKMTTVMAVLLAAGTALLWAWLVWTHRIRPEDPALRLYHKLQQRLSRRLGEPRLHEGPEDLHRRVAREAPELAGAVREFVDAYVAIRYQDDDSRDGMRRLRAALRRIGEGRKSKVEGRK
ncbi:MAG TPA: DUF3488 and transglutaminase-like domain-containing protein [Gammaproteobacteria bacterium]